MIQSSKARLLPFAIRAIVEQFAARATGRKLRLTPWVPMAQVEDDDIDLNYPEDQRLSAEVMRTLTANFNPSVYRPAVICGSQSENPGPAHYVGEYAEPLGWIVGLDFDGVHLWGQMIEIVDPEGEGRITEAVSCGHLGRSIGWWINKPGVQGGYMLRHLALLSGEPEGQMLMALPPLSQYFKDAFGGVEAARAESEPFRNSRTFIRPSGQRSTEMDKQLLEQLQGMLDTMQSGLKTEVESGVRTVEQKVDGVRSEIPGQVTAAVTPLVEGVRTELTAKLAEQATAVETFRTEMAAEITSLKTEVAEAKEAARAHSTKSREDGYRSELKQYASEFRFASGEIEPTVKALMGLPEEGARSMLDVFKGRAPMVGVHARSVMQIAGKEGEEPLEYEIPDGVDQKSFEQALRAEAALPEAQRTDANAFLAKAKQIGRPSWLQN